MTDTQPNAQLILSEQGIEVTPSIARFGGISYSVSNINSVYVSTLKKGSAAWLGWLLMIFFGVGAIGNLGQKNFSAAAACALIAAFLGWLASRGKARYTYTLMLKTSSGDQQAFATANREFAEKLKQALETAMTVRR